jgi:hypothetical protein
MGVYLWKHGAFIHEHGDLCINKVGYSWDLMGYIINNIYIYGLVTTGDFCWTKIFIYGNANGISWRL